MAYEKPVFNHSRTAGADLSAAQYQFVKLSGGNVVLCAAATDVPYGVLQNAPKSGEAAEVMLLGITKLKAGGAIAAGDLVGTDANGKGDTKAPGTDTTNYVVGQAVEPVSNADEIAAVAINTLNPHRAA